MTWLRSLAELDLADLPAVGPKAYRLGLLQRQGLPVAQGWVITAAAWHHSLAQLSRESLSFCQDADFKTLQRTSQQWQRALRQQAIAPLLFAGDVEPRGDFEPTAWLLRASLWMGGSATPQGVWAGMLPALVTADLDSLPRSLPQFWSQALAARCLKVWLHHHQHPQDLGLATLVMPIYPAVLAGTLTYDGHEATVAAVAGLGLALSRGEAMPARCQIIRGQAEWEEGFQEHLYQLTLRPGQRTGADPVQAVPRSTTALVAPLSPQQLAQLLAIAQAAQDTLAAPGVRLEWLFYSGAESPQTTLAITQADPWGSATPARSAAPCSGAPGQPLPPRPPPELVPMASAVVQGIGAAAGQGRGQAVVVQRSQDLPHPLPPGAVVVVSDLQPDTFLQLEGLGGIVTEQGGATCHAAILAREMGIPAVVGAPQATQLLESDMVIWLDGDRGLVYGFSPEVANRHPWPVVAPPRRDPIAPSPPVPVRTQVMVNLSQPRRLASFPLDQVAGVGLLRSEWLLLNTLEGRHPWDWVNRGQEADLQGQIVQQLEPILQALGPKPLRYRSLDLRSHEWQGLVGGPPVEPNPMLGLRGTLSYNLDSRLFRLELAALATLQRAGYTNLELILPFVRTVEEVIVCRQKIEQAGLTDHSDFALWIMAEVPSVLFLLPAYAQAGVQGIAIGSNDLTQLLLAVDRDQPTLASTYDERHPVVRLAMAHLVQEARRCGLQCSICGQAPVRHPDLIADLVAWGIDSISVEAAAIPFTLAAVWQAERGGEGWGGGIRG